MYSAFVWLASAIFVAICVTLDKTETFLVDCGTNCWLGYVNAKLYLFLLPLAILLFFNIVTFIRTALSLYRHEKERPLTLQRLERKQNLLMHLRKTCNAGRISMADCVYWRAVSQCRSIRILVCYICLFTRIVHWNGVSV